MAIYLNEEDQNEMAKLIYQYWEITNYSEYPPTDEANKLLDKFYKCYADKLINGVIYNPKYYAFWKRVEMDDLIQEGRMAILNSINKCQWDVQKGTIFNFFSTVVGRGLMNYTAKHNRHASRHSSLDDDECFSEPQIAFYHDYEKRFIMDDLQEMLLCYFKGKPKFEALVVLLIRYYDSHLGDRFVKKQFIEYAKAHGYSQSVVTVFFNALKNINYYKPLREFINILVEEQANRTSDGHHI